MAGRNDGNIKVIMPNNKISASRSARGLADIKSGDFVAVLVSKCIIIFSKNVFHFFSDQRSVISSSQRNPIVSYFNPRFS